MITLFLSLIESAEDQKAFEYLYAQYKQLLYYVAYQILKNQVLAEDAVQEAYLSLSLHMDQIHDPQGSSAKYFLTTIVKNKALDILRKEKGNRADMDYELFEQVPDTKDSDPLNRYLVKEQLEHITACLKRLDEPSRIVLEYKYLHQLKEREIAQLLGLPPKTINVRIYRARCRLAKLLEQEGITYGNLQ